MSIKLESLVRRIAVVVLGVLTTAVAGALTAAPAHADVPVGWSDNPESVNMVHALLLLAGVPILLGLVIIAGVYVPSVLRGERITPGAPAIEDQWLGGPRAGTRELAGPEAADSEAGGTSARW